MSRPAILNEDVVVVPREPTQEMVDAGHQYARARKSYAAMLAASPHADAWAEVRAYVGELEILVSRLRLEAQGHSMEADTANGTIADVYQAITSATGEPGNWNGAAPVKAYVKAAEARISDLEARLKEAERVMADVVKVFVASKNSNSEPCQQIEDAVLFMEGGK